MSLDVCAHDIAVDDTISARMVTRRNICDANMDMEKTNPERKRHQGGWGSPGATYRAGGNSYIDSGEYPASAMTRFMASLGCALSMRTECVVRSTSTFAAGSALLTAFSIVPAQWPQVMS